MGYSVVGKTPDVHASAPGGPCVHTWASLTGHRVIGGAALLLIPPGSRIVLDTEIATHYVRT